MADAKADLPKPLRVNGRFSVPWKCRKLPPNKMEYVFNKIFHPSNNSVPSQQELSQTLPVMKPDFDKLENPPKDAIQATWLGHSTVLLQMEGLTVITDPIFSSRCSPVQFAGPARYRQAPCTVNDLPPINAVLISHNHYDHLDLCTACELNARFGSDLHWYVPEGQGSWMRNNIGCKNVKEMTWWESDHLPDKPDVTFVFTPAQHWSGRSLFDTNKTLWGSWSIIGQSSRVFFAGDTGYSDVFKKIGDKYGPFAFSAIPIGAYEPRWFMRPQHIGPEEAVQIHKDICSRKSLGIHWGTFNLSDEHYLEPPKKLKEHHPEKDFFTVKHGETIHVESPPGGSSTNAV